MHTKKHTRTHKHIHKHTHKHTHKYTHTHTLWRFISVYTGYRGIQTHARARTHTHIHTHTQRRGAALWRSVEEKHTHIHTYTHRIRGSAEWEREISMYACMCLCLEPAQEQLGLNCYEHPTAHQLAQGTFESFRGFDFAVSFRVSCFSVGNFAHPTSVTLKRIGFFCFPIKHSTHTRHGSMKPATEPWWFNSKCPSKDVNQFNSYKCPNVYCH